MQNALDILRSWYSQELAESFPDCWVFGSLIYKDGELFDPLSSDIDLVVLLPDGDTAPDRITRLDRLRTSIQRLEIDLLQAFMRNDASSHITSVIPVTRHEIHLDIHKSVRSGFFTSNEFLSLRTGICSPMQSEGDCNSLLRADSLLQAIEQCQKYRNAYVACSTNASKKVEAFNTTDLIPKEIARSAAQVANHVRPRPGANAWDLNEGACYIVLLLTEMSEQHALVADLRSRCLSRMNRGSAVLQPNDIALLYEVLFENALKLQLEATTSGQFPCPAPIGDQHESSESKWTVVDEGGDERIVWLLPRGFILIEDVQFDAKPDWAIVLTYYDASGSWQQGTHYHSSYRDRWEDYEGKRIQFRKLGVPIGDWQFAEGALWLVTKLRERREVYDVRLELAQIATASKYTRYFAPDEPILLERLESVYSHLPVPAYYRDVLARTEELLLTWEKGLSREYIETEIRFLRQQSAIAAERLVGRTSPALRFVYEQIDHYDERGSLGDLREWVVRMKETLVGCLASVDE